MREVIRILSLIGLIGYSVEGQAVSIYEALTAAKDYYEGFWEGIELKQAKKYAEFYKENQWAPSTKEILESAKLSKASYEHHGSSKSKEVADWDRIGEHSIGGFFAGKGFHAVAFKHRNRDEMAVAFEGTKLLSRSDWWQNISKIIKPGHQSNDTLEFLIGNKEISEWIAKGGKITFTGHSLGGTLAQIAAAVTKNSKAITHNTAGVGKQMRDIIGKKNFEAANIISVRIGGDLISLGENFADHNIKLHSELKLKNHSINTIIKELNEFEQAWGDRIAQVREEPPTREEQAVRQNRLGQFGEFIRTNTNIGNSCIGGVSYPVIVDAPAIFDANENDERVFIDNTPGNNARETVNTDGFVLEAPVDIVLSWGGNPADLDSHLTGPLSEGRRFHVNFEERGSLNSGPRVLLHRDYTNHVPEGANLPEQVRVNRINDGIYRFYVHDYSNRNEVNTRNLANSGAAISIHNAGEFSGVEGVGIGEKVVPDISVPTDRVGNTWHAFDLDARTNTLIERDEFQDRTISNRNELSAVPFNEGSAEVQ